MSAEVISLTGKRTFTLEEAQRLLPIVKRFTEQAVAQTEIILAQMEKTPSQHVSQQELESALNRLVEIWVRKMERLGCEAKGLWLVDFDSGDGYYCWQFGDAAVNHFHGYAEGFAGRRPIVASTLVIH